MNEYKSIRTIKVKKQDENEIQEEYYTGNATTDTRDYKELANYLHKIQISVSFV